MRRLKAKKKRNTEIQKDPVKTFDACASKAKRRVFWRSFYISAVIVLCLLCGAFGMFQAYENTVRIGFGEYKKAIELTDDGIRIFDFVIEF